jgi:hypothetical protein
MCSFGVSTEASTDGGKSVITNNERYFEARLCLFFVDYGLSRRKAGAEVFPSLATSAGAGEIGR